MIVVVWEMRGVVIEGRSRVVGLISSVEVRWRVGVGRGHVVGRGWERGAHGLKHVLDLLELGQDLVHVPLRGLHHLAQADQLWGCGHRSGHCYKEALSSRPRSSEWDGS